MLTSALGSLLFLLYQHFIYPCPCLTAILLALVALTALKKMILFLLRLAVDFLDMVNICLSLKSDKAAVLKFRRVTDNAYAPVKADNGSAGYDLKAAYNHLILPTGKATAVHTDLQFDIPEGCYGRIASRSGLSVVNNVHVIAGVIDRNYRGNISVCLINLSNEIYHVHRGERIGQLILEKIAYATLQEEEELSATERGAKGFGSSGRF